MKKGFYALVAVWAGASVFFSTGYGKSASPRPAHDVFQGSICRKSVLMPGTIPDARFPSTCFITGPASVCPGAQTQHCAPAGLSTYAWSISGTGGTIVGPTDQPCVQVAASNTCNTVYTLVLTINNTTTCSATVAVNDQTPPDITCPPDITVSCASQVPPVDVSSCTASDNCDDPVAKTHVSDVIVNQSCANRFGIVRTYRASDACGNAVTCSYQIAVYDQLVPALSCPAHLTVSCVSEVPAVNPGSVTANDNCGDAPAKAHVSDVISNKTCDSRFVLTRTYKATDACNNTATCTQKITVNDLTTPGLICPPALTVSCASQVPAPNVADVTVTDNCSADAVKTFVGDLIPGKTCVNRYTLFRSYRVSDGCGGVGNCTQKITVDDQTPPAIACPANTTVSCVTQVPAVNLNDFSVADDCGGTATKLCVGDKVQDKTCNNRYVISRTFKATDACGNSSTCSQQITVNDQTPPSVSCPANITLHCAGMIPAYSLALVTASDNCGGAIAKGFVGDLIVDKSCDNRFLVLRTYKATDLCGNTAFCTQRIQVADPKAPVATCPAGVTVSCTDLLPAINPAAVNASDNCGGAVFKSHFGDVISSKTCDNRYTLTRTYLAKDACGNTATCKQQITVNDQTAPTITCPANTAVSCAGDVPAPNPAAVAASDNCGSPAITHLGDVLSNQTCANRYTLTRTYQAADACGKTATCKQLITVHDQATPAVTCPAHITVSCTGAVPAVNLAEVSATDNCGASMTKIHLGDAVNNQTCANRYTILRAYRVTDACGKSASCTQQITVRDLTPPAGQCPQMIPVYCAADMPCASPADPRMQALISQIQTAFADNCGGGVHVVLANASPLQACSAGSFTYSRSFGFNISDDCGNTTTCAVQLSGSCFCTYNMEDWGNPAGSANSLTTQQVLDTLLGQYGPLRIGDGANCGFAVQTSACVFNILPASGPAEPLLAGFLPDCSQQLVNTLAGQLLALRLNLRYNQYFRKNDLGGVVLSQSCALSLPQITALGLNGNATVADLAKLADDFLAGNCTGTAFPAGLGSSLSAALSALNAYWGQCKNNQPCSSNFGPEAPGDIADRAPVSAAETPLRALVLTPNPATTQLQIRFQAQASDRVQLRVFDVEGRLVRAQTLAAGAGVNTLDLDLSAWAPGIYALFLANSETMLMKRFVVQRL